MTNARNEQKWKELLLPKLIEAHCTPRVQEVLSSESFEEPDKVETHNQYLYGDSYTGKSIHAHLIMFEWCRKQYLEGLDFSGCLFVSVPFMLNQLRSTINTGGNPTDVLATFTSRPFLILDDIGTSKTTDWVLEQLYLLINYRYEMKLTTIYTSNYSLDELGEKLGDDRIPSRIQADCKIIKKTKLW